MKEGIVSGWRIKAVCEGGDICLLCAFNVEAALGKPDLDYKEG